MAKIPLPVKKAPASVKPLPVRRVAPVPVAQAPLKALPSKAPMKAPPPRALTPPARPAAIVARPVMKAPPRKVIEMSAHMYEKLTPDVVREALTQIGDMLGTLEETPWVAMDGKKTEIEMPGNVACNCAGFWFSVFRRDGDDSGALDVSVSQIARAKAHTKDTQGTMCERRIVLPLT